MKNPYGRLAPCVFAVLCSSSLSVAGNLAPACVAGTLANYQTRNVDSDCSVGILNFYNFEFLAVGTGNATLLSASQIELTPYLPPRNSGLSGGFTVGTVNSDPFTVGFGQTAGYVIDWHFDIDSGPTAEAAALGMDPPFGAVTITQDYCVDSQLFPVLSQTAGLPGATSCRGSDFSVPVTTLQVTTIPQKLTDGKPLTPNAFIFANVRTKIFLDGSNVASGFDNLTGSSTIIDTSAPEPGSILLGFGGLLSVFGLRRRFNRA